MRLNLIVETPRDNDGYEYIVEEKNPNQPRTYFVKGPYMMAEGVNRNKRRYPLDEMSREVSRYNTEMVATGRAMGELNHPTTADVDLSRACHVVTELVQEGNIVYGKSKVLSTPTGLIVRSLIDDGVKIGMSSRALGQLIPENMGVNRVKDFRLVCIDVVADPSYSSAFLNGVLESKQYVLAVDGTYSEAYERLEKQISKLPIGSREEYIRNSILSFIKSI